MKAILVRVKTAEVSFCDGNKFSTIGQGLVVFAGIDKNDTDSKLTLMADKIANLRIFEDRDGKLNYSIRDKNYEILCIPNFTLCANIKNGRRPSFENVMPKTFSEKLFESFILLLRAQKINIKSGQFAEDMRIKLDCDGPVNIIIDI